MHEGILTGLALLLVLGIAAQWLAWRMRLPSILLLLLFGFVAGPLTSILQPDALFGDLLLPIVSISVAIILFEGGLTLRFSELREVGKVVRNLITIGALVTWLLIAYAAQVILGMDLSLSLLLGGILVVSGPTVIGPLLMHVRPSAPLSAALKWEGILIDPVGALLAVLVFEVIMEQESGSTAAFVALAVLRTLAVGGILGLVGAWLLTYGLKRYWVPDELQNPVSLMVVIANFAISNHIQEESGLLTVTVMGIALANQNQINIRHLVAFKEDLRVLLISSLFIVLVSRLQWEQVAALNIEAIIFLLALILIVRPAAVAVSTLGSKLNWRERAFLAWVAPRGIVAASVSSVFSLRLLQEGYPRADELVSVTFLVIAGTVVIYGFSASPVARLLGVAAPNPTGLLFVGAHRFARAIAKALHDEGFRVLLVDTNRNNTNQAKMEGLSVYHGSMLSDFVALGGIKTMLALTPNEELNSLSSLHYAEFLGRSEVFQLVPEEHKESKQSSHQHLFGRMLFDEKVTYSYLNNRFFFGDYIKKTKISDEFTYADFQDHYNNHALPLFLIDEAGKLTIFTPEGQPEPKPGQVIISLVPKNSKA